MGEGVDWDVHLGRAKTKQFQEEKRVTVAVEMDESVAILALTNPPCFAPLSNKGVIASITTDIQRRSTNRRLWSLRRVYVLVTIRGSSIPRYVH